MVLTFAGGKEGCHLLVGNTMGEGGLGEDGKFIWECVTLTILLVGHVCLEYRVGFWADEKIWCVAF